MVRRFFAELFRPGNRLGAIAPSSKKLAKRMAHYARVKEANNILELGPGTGAFTGEILANKKPGAAYLAVELSSKFVDILKQQFPDLNVRQADVGSYDFGHHTSEHGQFDSVVSGLPWASFPEQLQLDGLGNVMDNLKEGGTFCTFAYQGFHLVPAGLRFRKLIRERFTSVEKSPLLLMNLPPAFVYICKK